jgi:hypothetical protein
VSSYLLLTRTLAGHGEPAGGALNSVAMALRRARVAYGIATDAFQHDPIAPPQGADAASLLRRSAAGRHASAGADGDSAGGGGAYSVTALSLALQQAINDASAATASGETQQQYLQPRWGGWRVTAAVPQLGASAVLIRTPLCWEMMPRSLPDDAAFGVHR